MKTLFSSSSRLPFAVFLLVLVALGCQSEPVTVETPSGALAGTSNGTTRVFLGIPFAAPPVGDLRFAAPQPLAPWKGVLDATAPSPICPQFDSLSGTNFNEDSDEDCLYLNIWAPTASGPHPVMVFMHGGGYVTGAGSEALYDGQRISEARRVIVITINYRLGPLGFLAVPGAANNGLRDQQEALRWLKKSISAFDGDPSRVTLFGESAGAGSTCVQLVSPAAAGLFQRAVLESAPCTGFDLPDAARAGRQFERFIQAIGCSGIAPDDGSQPNAKASAQLLTCLRQPSTKAVLGALPLAEQLIYGPGETWGPTVDGDVLPDQPVPLFRAGGSKKVSLIVGANQNEGTFFFRSDDIQDETDLRSALDNLFLAKDVDAIVARYGSTPTARQVAISIVSDVFTCDARRIARMHVAEGGVAYHYRFSVPVYGTFTGLGAFHASELPFVFDNPVRGVSILPVGFPLVKSMQGYWTEFARSGDPNGPSRLPWSRYNAGSDRSLQLDLHSKQVSGVQKEACDFWDTLRL